MNVDKTNYFIKKLNTNDSFNDIEARGFANNSQSSSEHHSPNTSSTYLQNDDDKYRCFVFYLFVFIIYN